MDMDVSLVKFEIWSYHERPTHEFCYGMKLMSKAYFSGNAIKHSNAIFGHFEDICMDNIL